MDDISIKKLELFLSCSSHGFMLLTANEFSHVSKVRERLKKSLDLREYRMSSTEYYTVLADMEKQENSEQSVLFYDFMNDGESGRELLEKFNKCSKNSPTSSGGQMNCTSEHICLKSPYSTKRNTCSLFPNIVYWKRTNSS